MGTRYVYMQAQIFLHIWTDMLAKHLTDGETPTHLVPLAHCHLPFPYPFPSLWSLRGFFPCFGSALLRSVDGPPMALDSLTFPQLVNSHVCNYARSSPNFFHTPDRGGTLLDLPSPVRFLQFSLLFICNLAQITRSKCLLVPFVLMAPCPHLKDFLLN